MPVLPGRSLVPDWRLRGVSRAQAADVDAMAAQIIPTDSTPGAREARVVQFIDRALVTFEDKRKPDYTRFPRRP